MLEVESTSLADEGIKERRNHIWLPDMVCGTRKCWCHLLTWERAGEEKSVGNHLELG